MTPLKTQKSYEISKTLDAQGLVCPEPVMMLHNIIRTMQSGDILEVVATDPSTQRDIPKFCTFLGHKLIFQAEHAGTFTYHLQKGG